MRLGVAIEETWDFFHEIYADFAAHHETARFVRPVVKLPALNGRLNAYVVRRELRSFLRHNDAVFFEWASELLALASQLPKTCGMVARLHRYEMYTWAKRINWDAVDRLVVVSEAKRREFTAAFPEHAGKLVMIPEAVSVTRFSPHPKRFAGDIGILCHIKPRKRVYELVLAFYELLQQQPSFRLHIGGGKADAFGDYYDAVHRLVERLGLGDRVVFYGHVAKPEEWYQGVDIFVSNAYSEGLQVSPMEAMASGCYCLAHRWDGAEELLPRSHLYDTNAELNALILRYAASSEEEKQREKARLRAIVCERFNVDETKTRIRELVEEAAASACQA